MVNSVHHTFCFSQFILQQAYPAALAACGYFLALFVRPFDFGYFAVEAEKQ